MKRLLAAALCCLVLLTGCTTEPQKKQYTATFLDVFDTVTTITGRAESEEAFETAVNAIHEDLTRYHQLFDIYSDYHGLMNLKTVNDAAGKEAVTVSSDIITLLEDCKGYYELTGGMVNVAMGSVLSLWHDARENSTNDPQHPYLPEESALTAAAAHTDIANIRIDRENSTVFLADAEMRLDVGAVAKGWAAQKVAEKAPAGLLISVGGNVCATGPKDEQGTPWVVGVNDPDGGDYLHTLYIKTGSVVTSGDYQRYFVVNGKRYHHIIHPETLQPSEGFRSVTIVCPDSGLADALSTALFLLPYEDGKALAERSGAQAMWVTADGKMLYTDGFSQLVRT